MKWLLKFEPVKGENGWAVTITILLLFRFYLGAWEQADKEKEPSYAMLFGAGVAFWDLALGLTTHTKVIH